MCGYHKSPSGQLCKTTLVLKDLQVLSQCIVLIHEFYTCFTPGREHIQGRTRVPRVSSSCIRSCKVFSLLKKILTEQWFESHDSRSYNHTKAAEPDIAKT